MKKFKRKWKFDVNKQFLLGFAYRNFDDSTFIGIFFLCFELTGIKLSEKLKVNKFKKNQTYSYEQKK